MAPLVFYVKRVASGRRRARLKARPLLANHMFRVVVVLAHVLADVVIGVEIGGSLYNPRLGVRTGVLNREFDFKMPQIGTPHAFGYVQLFGVRMALGIQPRPVDRTRPYPQSACRHSNARSSGPSTEGVRIFRDECARQKHLTMAGDIVLEEHHR